MSLEEIAGSPADQEWIRGAPYRGVLDRMGRSPDGSVDTHPRVVEVDFEGVADETYYPDVLRRLSRAAGTADRISAVHSLLDGDRCEFALTVDGRRWEFEPRVDGDWADPDVMGELFWLVAPAHLDACQLSVAQSTLVAYVPLEHAEELQALFQRWGD